MYTIIVKTTILLYIHRSGFSGQLHNKLTKNDLQRVLLDGTAHANRLAVVNLIDRKSDHVD